MSDVRPEAPTFFSLYSAGLMEAERIDDFIEAWHNSGDDEKRSLPQYLGMTDDEYAVWVMSHAALPTILAARRDRRPLPEAISDYYVGCETRIHPIVPPFTPCRTGCGSASTRCDRSVARGKNGTWHYNFARTVNTATKTFRRKRRTRASAPTNAHSAPIALRPGWTMSVRIAAAGSSQQPESGRRRNGGRACRARNNQRRASVCA